MQPQPDAVVVQRLAQPLGVAQGDGEHDVRARPVGAELEHLRSENSEFIVAKGQGKPAGLFLGMRLASTGISLSTSRYAVRLSIRVRLS